MSSEVLWYASRASGVTSIVLLTAVMALGTLLPTTRHSPATTTVKMAVHRWLSLAVLVFLALHIVTAVFEGFVPISWAAVVVPFTSGWQPLWIGLGALAVDLLAVTVVTSLLRPRLPERLWRGLHWLTYALWPLAIAHGIALGTANEPILRGTTIACAVVGLGAVAVRSVRTHADGDRRRDVLSQEWS